MIYVLQETTKSIPYPFDTTHKHIVKMDGQEDKAINKSVDCPIWNKVIAFNNKKALKDYIKIKKLKPVYISIGNPQKPDCIWIKNYYVFYFDQYYQGKVKTFALFNYDVNDITGKIENIQENFEIGE